MNLKLKSVLWVVCFVITLALAFAFPRLVSGQKTLTAQCMGGGMMNGGMMNEDMQIVRQLFANHDKIHRTVEEISGGIRAVTESDDPQIAALIQHHVTSMYQRVDDGRTFSMMSQTLPIMFRNANNYKRKFETTTKGLAVTEISDDTSMVAVIREHAREVNRFVAEGMSAMCGGMMR
jgi:hypothetical protein